jgi:hypothetical protein
MTDTVHSSSVEEAQEDMRIRCSDLWSELQKVKIIIVCESFMM